MTTGTDSGVNEACTLELLVNYPTVEASLEFEHTAKKPIVQLFL